MKGMKGRERLGGITKGHITQSISVFQSNKKRFFVPHKKKKKTEMLILGEPVSELTCHINCHFRWSVGQQGIISARQPASKPAKRLAKQPTS